MDDLPTDDSAEPVLPSGLDESDRHRLLADSRRRAVLRALVDRGGSTDRTTLCEFATAVDRAEPRDDGETGNHSLVVDLHHVHLPLLDDVGVLSYDPETKRVDLPDPDGEAARAGGGTNASP